MEQEQYVYLIRLVKEEYSMPHTRAFISKEVAENYFESDVKFYRKKGWDVDDDENYCGGVNTIRRADMIRKNEEGNFEHMELLLQAFEIIKN